MKYYAYIKDNSIIGCGICTQEDYENFEIGSDIYEAIIKDPTAFIFIDNSVRLDITNPTYINTLSNKVKSKITKLLESEVDPIACNVLRWEELSEEEKLSYKNYRLYLKDFDKQEEWWTLEPKSFKEWLNG